MNSRHSEEMELISQSISLISKKWHSKIVYQLLNNGRANFSQLRDSLDNVSNKVLSESLKDLREKNIVEKVEEDDSTEYQLTQKGRELEEAFESLSDWGRKHVAEQKPGVLIVEDNEQQARMYKRWLEPSYDAYIATNSNELFSNLQNSIDAVLLDRKLPDTSAEELLKSSEELSEKQVVIITGLEPSLDLIELDINDYILKPISRDDLRNSVNRVIRASMETENENELLALLSKKEVLDRKPHSVRESEEYRELMNRIETLREGVDELPEISEKSLDDL